ncbi:hypothetical protein PLESTB_001053600 [Pleodorina starrii]|uniref:Uncharacterized protein n=1 Tax=Pleodorina starrii TaxID=330485 RepID=A0A9W6BQG7_9CHLO|nr:hypothetical protein PLESTB_001053600 [Pleodorina starrii]
MASSRGGVSSDLHGNADPRTAMMLPRELSNADDAEAMDVDQQTAAASSGPLGFPQLPNAASPFTSGLGQRPSCSGPAAAAPLICADIPGGHVDDGHLGRDADESISGAPSGPASTSAWAQGAITRQSEPAAVPAAPPQPPLPTRLPPSVQVPAQRAGQAGPADGMPNDGGGGGLGAVGIAATASAAAQVADGLCGVSGRTLQDTFASAASGSTERSAGSHHEVPAGGGGEDNGEEEAAGAAAASQHPDMMAADAAEPPRHGTERPSATAAPARSRSVTAAVVPTVYPYFEYDPYAAAQAPVVSYYSYALAEDGDEEDDEGAAGDGWAEEEGGSSEDLGGRGGEEPAAGMDYDDAAAAAAGGRSPLPQRQGYPSGSGDGGASRHRAAAPPAQADRGYDSADTSGTEDMEGGGFPDEDDEYGGAEREDAYGGAWARPRPAAAAVGAPWDPHRRQPHAGGSQCPFPPPLAHQHLPQRFRTRPEGYNQKAGAAGTGCRGGDGASGSGSGAAATAARADPGPSGAAGAGPSTAGPGGAGGGGWSLRFSLGPNCVSDDPWSEDEEEETDTTAEQFYTAAQPKDIQGIPWERLQFNRSTYRETRLRQYRNYTNVLPDNNGGAYRAELAPLCAAPRRCGTAGGGASGAARGPPFFSFVRNSRAVQSNIVHFQLRNLVWATSPNDVFVVHDNCINHWNPAARSITEVLNLGGAGGGGGGGGGGGAARRAADDSSRIQALGRVQVSTLCVSGDLVAAGGFMGELVVKRINGAEMAAAAPAAGAAAAGAARGRAGAGGRFAPGPAAAGAAAAPAPAGAGGGAAAGGTRGGVGALGRGAVAAAQGPVAQARGAGKAGGGGSLLFCGRITASDNGITNGLEIFSDRSHGTVIMAANNDQKLRLFAAAAGEGSLRPLSQWPFDWAVNYATVRPDSHLAAVVGDDSATLLTDVHNGAVVARLEGHQDFSFAAAWHPGGVLLATGNQDTTTLLWDVRKTNEPLTRLAGRMGAIRSLRFTPDGRFLAMSEPADFVHVYDVASGFQDCQEHDFFGEIAGIAFTPDSSSLFVGISDLTYASLMHLERQRCDWW